VLGGRVLSGAGGAPDYAAASRLLPELIRLNDAQAGLGAGGTAFRDLITRTLVTGGDGYCLHSTLAAGRTPGSCSPHCAGSAETAARPFRQGLISHISISNS
jgi:hypothetical protein